jgi:hypothetical protein
MSKQVVQSFAIVPQEVIGNWHLETEWEKNCLITELRISGDI